MQRIAVPMIGGMISSTILTLVVIPAVYCVDQGAWVAPRTECGGFRWKGIAGFRRRQVCLNRSQAAE